MEVVFEGLPVGLARNPLDTPEDIGGFPEVNEMGQVVFLGSAWHAHVDLDEVGLEFGTDQEIDSEIHRFLETKKQVF